MKRLCLCGALFLVAAPISGIAGDNPLDKKSQQQGTDSETDVARRQLIAASRHLVLSCENELDKRLKLAARRFLSDGDVDLAEVRLARARHDLALAELKPERAVEQLRLIIQIRERELARLEKVMGRRAASEAELDVAKRRLASVRYRLAVAEKNPEVVVHHLRIIIALCEREAERLVSLRNQKVVSDADVAIALDRLAYARYRQAWAEGKADIVLEQLRVMIVLREQESNRLEKVVGRKAAAKEEADVARLRLLEARQRLAIAQENADAVGKELRLLVALHEQQVKSQPGIPVEEYKLFGQRWQLAHARYRLTLVFKGVMPPLDDPGDELEG